MKIVYKQYNAVASWRWDVDPSGSSSGGGPSAQKDTLGHLAVDDDEEEDEDDEEDDEESDDEEEMCGVCQQEFESACPGCKTPGDDCPLIWGECKHVFHMHCLLQWLQTPSSKEQCPLDRRPWAIMGPPSFVPANGTTISAPQVTPLDAEGEYNRSETHTIRPNGTDTDAAEAEHESTPPSIHTLSQAGDLPALHALKQSGNLTEETVNSRDEQGVTALHWAAINNHVAVCRFLLELGAEIDPVGGELKATPLMWAARNGHLYVIHLLLQHSADPNLRDSQGFNTLHLATHSSGVMALLYMLHQPIAVDEKDTDGHTALMWAAWQGDAISIDLLLKHGASVDATDNSHLTPLHWATIKASRPCIDRLVSAGAKLDARDDAGKSARDMADEMKILEPYRLGLHDAGYALDGFKIQSALDPKRTQYAILLAPTVFLGAVFASIAYLPIYVGIPFAAALFFGMHHLLTRTLLGSAGFGDTVSKSPYFAAIITASLVWVGLTWLTQLLTGTPNGLILNFWFALAYITCAYNFYRAITLDPGHSRLPQDEAELNSLVEDLASTGRLNGTIFCISCMALKPLRAKHCRICDRCTARFDHHCPWIWNCVGSGNHRQFLLFVGALVAGISLFDALAISYYTSNAPTYVPPPSDYLEFCDVMPSLCRAYNFAPFVLAVALWSTLQLTWTIILLATQIFQVCRQMTTLEVSNLGRYGFMGGKGGSSLREQGGAMAHLMAHQSQQPSSLGAGPGQSGAEEEGLVISSNGDGDAVGDSARPLGGTNDIHVHGPGCKHNANGVAGHQHHHHRFGIVGKICSTALRACTGGPMLQLLGLDRFTKGKAIEGMRKSGQGGTGSNPFSVGLVGNCHDFWTNGGALGVDYTALYEIPPDGFHYKPQGLMTTIRNRGQPGSTSRNRDYEMLPSHDNV